MKGSTAMFAVLALAGDLGCTSGPTLVGGVMGLTGGDMKTGLLSAAVFPAVMLVSSLLYLKGRKNKENG